MEAGIPGREMFKNKTRIVLGKLEWSVSLVERDHRDHCLTPSIKRSPKRASDSAKFTQKQWQGWDWSPGLQRTPQALRSVAFSVSVLRLFAFFTPMTAVTELLPPYAVDFPQLVNCYCYTERMSMSPARLSVP